MSDFPNRCSCRSRASPRRGIHCLLAGVRSLLADRPGAPRSLRLWALVGRLAVAVVCFAGGLLIAEHFAEGIAVTLLDAGMAWVVIPIAVGVGSFLAVLAPLFVSWLWHRFSAWSRSQCKGADQ